ncbi:MAG: sensor histidine kinase [Anaerolineae bacterium]|nr:sensor histidine kinase [Anaerolineae bacterium]
MPLERGNASIHKTRTRLETVPPTVSRRVTIQAANVILNPHMKNNQLRIPVLLDVATYISIAAMSLLGISGFDSLELQLITLGLCLLFGILHRFYFRTEAFQRNPNIYFGVQTFILTLVLSLGSSSTDAFNFLFIILAVHTAHVLPGRHALLWIGVYYFIVSFVVLATRGTEGIYAVLFYGVSYILSGFFGTVLQQAEKARDQNQQLVDELKATQERLKELAVVEERNRLARDLHDSVKQQVFAISMQLSAARTALSEADKAYRSVTEAERLAQQAGTELTSLINALRPPALERRSLPDAVRGHVEEWSRQNPIEVNMDIDPMIRTTEQVEQALFRVLQEALANVARHSRADKVNVELKSKNDVVELTIEDNGIGFDARQIAKGIGLASMQERLVAVNGKADVESERSKGTRVIARVRMSS